MVRLSGEKISSNGDSQKGSSINEQAIAIGLSEARKAGGLRSLVRAWFDFLLSYLDSTTILIRRAAI